MARSSVRYALFALAFAALSGCGGNAPEEATDSSEATIKGGVAATGYPEALYINMQKNGSWGYACSGSLIAPKVVLTAGHCIAGITGWMVTVGGSSYLASGAEVYDYTSTGGYVDVNKHDIGLVYLSQSVTLSNYPALGPLQIKDGSAITNVGRKLNGTLTNSLWQADTNAYDGWGYGYPHHYRSAEITEPGDSGGPVFLKGTHTIIGVNSGGGSGMQVTSRLDQLYTWILGKIGTHGGGGNTTGPTLVAPNGTVTSNIPTFQWQAVEGATSYGVWINDQNTPGEYKTTITATNAGCGTGTGTCSFTPPAALSTGGGKFSIQTWKGTTEGAWSAPMAFTINPSYVGVATLIAPSGTITTDKPTYSWNAVAGATSYLLLVNDSKTKSKIQQSISASDAGCAEGGTCTFTPSTALYSGAGSWNIQATAAGGQGAWASAKTFTVTLPAPTSPALTSPSNTTVTTTTPTYVWSASSAITTYYYLWVDDSKAKGKIKLWVTPEQAGCSQSTTCSYTPSTTLYNGTVTWNVRAVNAASVGPWASAAKSFTVAIAAATGATLTGPTATTVTTTTPTYSWTAGTNVANYYLWVDDTKTKGKIKKWISPKEAGCDEGNSCSFTASTGLFNGTITWNVQAVNALGIGPWAGAKTFTVAIAASTASTLLGPSGETVTTTLPTFTWTAGSNAAYYQLWVDDTKAKGKIKKWITPQEAGCAEDTSCSYTPTVALANGAVTWNVQTVNAVGLGPWGTAKTFTVAIPVPTTSELASPSAGETVTTSRPTYSWKASANAVYYQIWVDDVSARGKVKQWVTPAQAGCDTDDTCSFTPTTSLARGKATWNVQSANAAGVGVWSSARNFTVSY